MTEGHKCIRMGVRITAGSLRERENIEGITTSNQSAQGYRLRFDDRPAREVLYCASMVIHDLASSEINHQSTNFYFIAERTGSDDVP